MPGYSVTESNQEESHPFPGVDGAQYDLIEPLDLDRMRMRMWYIEPDGTSNLHRHEVQEEVYHFLDGPAQIQFERGDDTERVDVAEGSTVKVEPSVPRQIINTSGSTLRILAVAAPNEMEGEIWDPEGEEYVPLQEWFQRLT